MLKVDHRTSSKEVISYRRMEVMLGKVLQLPTQTSLLVGDLHISILVEADLDSNRHSLIISPDRTVGAKDYKARRSRQSLEIGGDNVSLEEYDVSPHHLNLERPSNCRSSDSFGSDCASKRGSKQHFKSLSHGLVIEDGSSSNPHKEHHFFLPLDS